MAKELETESAEQSNSRPWLYKKGQSGNPSGRPKGRKSMKQWIKEKMERMTDKEREEFLEGLPKDKIWEMGEGRPTGVDVAVNTDSRDADPETKDKIKKALENL